MSKTNPKVDAFIRRQKKWQDELKALRAILLESELTEELKWRQPCYTFGGSNVLILGGFKDWCVLSFFKGALLKDPQGLLSKPGENTQAGRVIRFTSVEEIQQRKRSVKALIAEAIKVEKAGLKVEFKKITEHKAPEEFQEILDKSPALKKAFTALTPGRQRAYLLHFSQPKQSQTRVARIEKCKPKILAGQGLDDEYRAKR